MALESFDDVSERPRKKKRDLSIGKLIGILVLAILVAFLGVAGFLYSQGVLTPWLRHFGIISEELTVAELETEDVIYDFPIMIVTLLDDRGRRLQMLIEMRFILGSEEHIPIIETKRPVLEDLFNYYLREVRIGDVRDRRLMDTFRQVVLEDVNTTLAPRGVVVRDLLFMDFAMQQQ